MRLLEAVDGDLELDHGLAGEGAPRNAPLLELAEEARHARPIVADILRHRIFDLACPASPVHYQFDPVQTTKQLAEKVIRMVGSRSKLVFARSPQDDPRQRRPDITLAQEKLRWRPQVDLEDGLQETIAYFRKTLDLRQPRPQPVSAEQPRTRIETA